MARESKNGKTESRENIKQLKERVKELNCLYQLTKIVRDDKLAEEEVFEKVLEIIPPSWQYPEITCARLKVNNTCYETKNFKKTPWIQSGVITSEGKIIGKLEICYLEKKPTEAEGPFLVEERRLIDVITDLLSKFIDERRLKEELQQHREQINNDQNNVVPSERKKFKQDWEVIIDLLIKTDPRILLRITRKMVYYLYRYENKRITELINNVCPVDRESSEQQWCGINMPNPRQDIAGLNLIQERVFEIARDCLSSDELSELFQNWMKQDKIRPLLITSQKRDVQLVNITNELIRFFEKTESDSFLFPEDETSIRTALIRRFFTGRLEYVNVAKRFITTQDFVPLLKHVIGPAQSGGKLGGKTSGVLLAQKIIETTSKKDEQLKDIQFPRSWYLSSDTIFDFIHYNDLDEIFHHKYLNPDEIRQEQPFLEQIFKNSVFPPEIVEGLRKVILDLEGKPIIVRSSSLLEDSFGAAFSGKYKSLFVPNTGTEEERLFALLDAISEVFASTFGPDPIEYRRERGLLDFSEEMGVLIQEVIGRQIGHYFMPLCSGVAFSRNEFRWSPRILREDGVIRLVPGLGTRAVDRVANDYPILLSPNRPNLQVNTLVPEKIKYSPRYMDVINLSTGAIETVDAFKIFKTYAEEFDDLDLAVSIHENSLLKIPQKIMFDPKNSDLVITFEKLLTKTDFLEKIKKILKTLEKEINAPVDIEFAYDGKKLYLLQCRPQSQSLDAIRKPIPKNIPATQKLFSATKYITTGQLENIEYVVYVKPEEYSRLPSREKMQEVANVIGKLNTKLPRKKFILMGPGRWGSRGDIKLGVPVNYRDINNTSLLVEIAKEKEGYTPELSFGTHFFQDLVEAEIKYLPLYPDNEENTLNEDDLIGVTNHLLEFVSDAEDFSDVVFVVKVSDIQEDSTLSIIMDGEAEKALGYLKPADHWNWRMKKVDEIAQELDAEVYGVKALYLIGSVKEGNPGPASDIDFIVHFKGTEEQKEKLRAWFDQWSKKLDEENEKRIGEKTGGLLDVHYITDEDIEKQSAWAIHIIGPFNSAKKLQIH